MEAFLAFCIWAGGWALASFLFVVGILGAWLWAGGLWIRDAYKNKVK